MRTGLVTLLATLLTATASAGAPLVGVSASARALHDSNVFLQHAGALAPGQTSRAAAANADDLALDVTIGLTAKWTFAGARSLELGYSPELVRYLDHASENHTDHALSAAGGFTTGPWSGDFKARHTYVDGSNVSPIYNGLGGTPAIGGEPVRSRREQAIAKASAKLTRQVGAGFVRAGLALADQQFHTEERNAYGYCNYTDRSEAAVAVEAGRKAWSGLALVGGIRAGRQRQANTAGVPLNFSNTFTRYLGGVEGTIGKTLKLSALAGPDFRHYGESVRAGFARRRSTWYGEASATWTPNRQDTVAVTAKRYLWLSSGGRSVLADAVVDVSWKHTFNAQWAGYAGVNWHDGDTGHLNGWAPRHERIYTGVLGVSRTFAKKLRVDLEVMHDTGESMLPNTPGRDYERWISSVTVSRSW